jgi:hypothetical protein
MDISMNIEEGQIYEGTISLTGSEGRQRRWIVVAPFGKTQIHSIDDPTDLRCWPVALIEEGLRNGRLKLVGKDPNHPILQLQRDKEAHNIRDPHLGLRGERMEKMFSLLQEAAESDKSYTPYVAGEILEFMNRTALRSDRYSELEADVCHILTAWSSHHRTTHNPLEL